MHHRHAQVGVNASEHTTEHAQRELASNTQVSKGSYMPLRRKKSFSSADSFRPRSHETLEHTPAQQDCQSDVCNSASERREVKSELRTSKSAKTLSTRADTYNGHSIYMHVSPDLPLDHTAKLADFRRNSLESLRYRGGGVYLHVLVSSSCVCISNHTKAADLCVWHANSIDHSVWSLPKGLV